MNKKIFDRHLLFSNKNENRVFDQHPTLTRSISSNNKNKTNSIFMKSKFILLKKKN